VKQHPEALQKLDPLYFAGDVLFSRHVYTGAPESVPVVEPLPSTWQAVLHFDKSGVPLGCKWQLLATFAAKIIDDTTDENGVLWCGIEVLSPGGERRFLNIEVRHIQPRSTTFWRRISPAMSYGAVMPGKRGAVIRAIQSTAPELFDDK
jgi:hypothetical protein